MKMSKCISREGEYSDHTSGDERFYCGRCYVFDESAAVSALEAAGAERDAALARIAELEDTLAQLEAHLEANTLKDNAYWDMEDRAVIAEARIAEAAKLHQPRKHWNSDREYVFVCEECTRINRYGIARWPCPTAVALGLNEEER